MGWSGFPCITQWSRLRGTDQSTSFCLIHCPEDPRPYAPQTFHIHHSHRQKVWRQRWLLLEQLEQLDGHGGACRYILRFIFFPVRNSSKLQDKCEMRRTPLRNGTEKEDGWFLYGRRCFSRGRRDMSHKTCSSCKKKKDVSNLVQAEHGEGSRRKKNA